MKAVSHPAVPALSRIVSLFLAGTPAEGLADGLPGSGELQPLNAPICPCSVVRLALAPSPAVLEIFAALTDAGLARRLTVSEVIPDAPSTIAGVLVFAPDGVDLQPDAADLLELSELLEGVAELVAGPSAVFTLDAPFSAPALRVAFTRHVLPTLPAPARLYRFNGYARAALLIRQLGVRAAIARVADIAADEITTPVTNSGDPLLDSGWRAVAGLAVPFSEWIAERVASRPGQVGLDRAATFVNALTLASTARMATSPEGPEVARQLLGACRVMNDAVGEIAPAIYAYDDLLSQREALVGTPALWVAISQHAQTPFHRLM